MAASGTTQEQILTRSPQLTSDALRVAASYSADVLKGCYPVPSRQAKW